MRPFSYFGAKYFSISRNLDVARTRRRCQRHLRGALKGMRLFLFSDPNFFFDISNPGYGTDATEVSTAPTRCPKSYATIFIFRSKIFFSISRLLNVARARRKCQRHLRGALKSMRPFSFFGPKIFFSISRILNLARARWKCQRHLRGTLKDIQPYHFSVQKFFFRYLEFWMWHGCDGGFNGTYTVP